SQSLKHLTLTLCSGYKYCTLSSTWDLPALTTLSLSGIKLDDNFFSNCPNLKNLTLYSCHTTIRLSEESGEYRKSPLNICLSKLSNLSLKNVSCKVVNVEAPQLKNLIMRQDYYYNVNFSADAVLSLEKVDLTISYPHKAQTIVGLLQQFRSVKFLTLNLEIVECLSSSAELISHQPSPFANLKSLKIYPALKTLHVKANVSTFVESYFLDSSQGVTLTMVLREDIRAHELMEELQELLNWWKANSDNNTAQVDLGEVENQTAQQETIIESQSGERLTHIKSYWSDLTKWSEEGEERSCCIISMLQEIKSLLIELPASHRAKMQPMYSCLHAEADTFMDNMMDRVRIHCDKKPRRSNVHCHELATPSQPFPEYNINLHWVEVMWQWLLTSWKIQTGHELRLGATVRSTDSVDRDEVNSELAIFTEACQAAYEASKPKIQRTPVERDHYDAHNSLVAAYFSEHPRYDEAKFRLRFWYGY
ncbi:F-box domain containing protein, partial [Tanacetum coccineum]